ncbi:MAG: endonuclease/exonuclease/phosphatase family protein [Saprospiraceae bacterium]
MKKLYIVIILFAIMPQLIAQKSLENLSFGTDSTFEVITWNIEWFPKNGSVTVDSVRKIVEALDADIIACQEIGDTNIWKQMVDSLDGYETYFQTNWYAGLAYLYKTNSVQIQDYYEIYETSPYWNAFPRAPKVLEVIFNNQLFIIINNHYKCCGDGFLNLGNTSDEEDRRYRAMNLLKTYMDDNFGNDNVILTGDLNDILTDNAQNNVFQNIIDDSTNYYFADMDIAQGLPFGWSYPNWPSHLDHILITNELFDELDKSSTSVETIFIENEMVGGFGAYDSKVSDHRPVGIRFVPNPFNVVSTSEKRITELNYAPNPASNFVQIDLGESIQDGQINIYSATGQLVKSLELSSQAIEMTISVEDLPNGVYYMQLTESETIKAAGKLVILH